MAELKLGPPNVQDFQTRTAPTIRFSFFECGAVLDFLRSRNLQARLPMRGTSGSVRRSPANPARPGREQRYRDRFVRRGVPEVPLICSASIYSWSGFVVTRVFRRGDFELTSENPHL